MFFKMPHAPDDRKYAYDGKQIPELHVAGHRFQVGPVKLAEVLAEVLVPPANPASLTGEVKADTNTRVIEL